MDGMAMENIVEVFKSWLIPENVIQNFIDNGLTVDLLPKLTTENLKELCPHMGTRIVLQEKISELITANATTETTVTSLSNTSTLINNNEDNEKLENVSLISLDGISLNELIPSNENNICITRTFPDFDLATLLQTTPGGASILNYYKTFGSLNNTKRNQLTDIVVKHIYTHIVNSKITYEEYNILAAKIITLFPSETIGTYYTKPIRKNQSINNRSTIAKGKLVDKVRNLIYKFGDRKRQSNNTESEPPAKKIYLNLKERHQAALLWLQNNHEPWDDVEKKWRETFVLRRETEHQNLNDFLREWKILNHQKSDVLINIDFELMYPDKGVNFYINFDKFYQKLIGLKKTNDEAVLEIINSIEYLDDDLKIPSQINVLAHLVPPKGRLTKKLKFSTQEAIDSIFVCAKTSGDIEHIISTQKEKASLKKLSVQPYIILQGPINNCSSPCLVIDNIKYFYNSIGKAFDTLFKIYHVFHARYPKSSDHLYLIIQRCVYNIKTQYDNIVPYITDILEL